MSAKADRKQMRAEGEQRQEKELAAATPRHPYERCHSVRPLGSYRTDQNGNHAPAE